MDRERRQRLNNWMRTHRGLITLAEAEALDIDADDMCRAVDRGELERVRQRVYRSAGSPASWQDELTADVEACHAPAWAAYSAALELHEIRLPWITVERELVVVGSGRPTVAGDAQVHRTTTLDPIDQTIIDDTPSTTAPRAVIDMGARYPPFWLLQLMDEAIMCGAVDETTMYERALALRSGRRGVGHLVRATAPGAAQRFKSRLEKLGLPLLLEAGVTDPQVNVVPRHAPAAGLTDVVSEPDRLIVDWDGLRFHAGPSARQRDNDKANAAALGGYTALRFTWVDVTGRKPHVVNTARRARAGNGSGAR